MIKKYGIYAFLFIFMILSPTLLAANKLIQIEVDYVEGVAFFQKSGTYNWTAIEKGMLLSQDDSIRTGQAGIVDLKFDDNTFTRIGENTVIKIEQAQAGEYQTKKLFFSKTKPQKSISLNMEKGSVLSKVGKMSAQSSFSITTPAAVCGVRGTLFSASHNLQTSVKVLNGVVAVSNIAIPDAPTLVMPGQTTTVASGQTPEPPRQMTASEAGEVKSFLDGSSSSAAPIQESAAPVESTPATTEGSALSEAPAATPTSAPAPVETAKPTVTVTPPPTNITNIITQKIVETVTTQPTVSGTSKLQINVNLK